MMVMGSAYHPGSRNPMVAEPACCFGTVPQRTLEPSLCLVIERPVEATDVEIDGDRLLTLLHTHTLAAIASPRRIASSGRRGEPMQQWKSQVHPGGTHTRTPHLMPDTRTAPWPPARPS